MTEEEPLPSEEELKKMLDAAKKAADKKREEQSSKVSGLKKINTSDIEKTIEKKKSENK